jgi:IMP cyclohydrolase
MHEEKSREGVYCGRVVGVFMTPAGAPGVAYRVSSRSFPNRRAEQLDDGARIVPLDPREARENPYIAYRCLRHDGAVAVASNGSHTDAVFERIAAGLPPREALVLALLAFDYEHDALSTPRIAAAVRRGSTTGYLGIVRADGLQVEAVPLSAGRVHFVATYALDRIGAPGTEAAFAPAGPGEAVGGIFSAEPFSNLLHPVCGACAVAETAGFAVAVGQAAQ